jgi:CheY-like chemotaxis protein
MHAEKVRVLLIRENQNTYATLSDRLRGGGCDCLFAMSKREVGALLEKHSFDLVLGPIRLKNESLYPLIDVLVGSRTTLFYSKTVEDGYWWLPALRRGLDCFGTRAFRPREFVTVLDQTIEEIRSGMDTDEKRAHFTFQHPDTIAKHANLHKLPRPSRATGSPKRAANS